MDTRPDSSSRYMSLKSISSVSPVHLVTLVLNPALLLWDFVWFIQRMIILLSKLHPPAPQPIALFRAHRSLLYLCRSHTTRNACHVIRILTTIASCLCVSTSECKVATVTTRMPHDTHPNFYLQWVKNDSKCQRWGYVWLLNARKIKVRPGASSQKPRSLTHTNLIVSLFLFSRQEDLTSVETVWCFCQNVCMNTTKCVWGMMGALFRHWDCGGCDVIIPVRFGIVLCAVINTYGSLSTKWQLSKICIRCCYLQVRYCTAPHVGAPSVCSTWHSAGYASWKVVYGISYL